MDKKEYIRIQGGFVLNGEVSVSGSKNAILPLLFSSLLAEGKHEFHNVPYLKDIDIGIQILESIGLKVERKENKIIIHTTFPLKDTLNKEYVKKMRASILCLGPLLAIKKSISIPLPGGCSIGKRPIDFHIHAMKELGAIVYEENDEIIASVSKKLKGSKIKFRHTSVGATENTILASVLAEGETFIEEAALEPEVLNLISYLRKMGAQIKKIDDRNLYIKGVKKLSPPDCHLVIPDRIEAGTLLLAGAITKGSILIKDMEPKHLTVLIQKLEESNFKLKVFSNSIYLTSQEKASSVDIQTGIYPEFPSDLQAPFVSLMTQTEGQSVIEENIFENRFHHIKELKKMGAQITTQGKKIFIEGESNLKGNFIKADDLRGAASLILAGLIAKGFTYVSGLEHLDRGYEGLHKKLKALEAKIERLFL